MLKVKKVVRSLDWKQWHKGWPYKGLNDPKYLRDRLKLFKSNGHGWWLLTPFDNPYSDNGK